MFSSSTIVVVVEFDGFCALSRICVLVFLALWLLLLVVILNSRSKRSVLRSIISHTIHSTNYTNQQSV